MNWPAGRWRERQGDMHELVRIREKETAQRWREVLTGDDRLPPFLFDGQAYNSIVIGMKIDGNYAGMAYGVNRIGSSQFHFHNIYITGAYRHEKQVLYLLEAILKTALQQPGTDMVVWNFTFPKGRPNTYKKLMMKLPSLDIEKEQSFYQYAIKTADFDHLRRFFWYKPDRLGAGGFCARPWDTYPEKWKAVIREAEAAKADDPEYLSPFFSNPEERYDPVTSYVLTHSDSEIPLGWLICERTAAKVVKIRRFYSYKESRKQRMGPVFAAVVLEKIASTADILLFDVRPENRPMVRFADVCCEPVLMISRQAWTLHIKQK